MNVAQHLDYDTLNTLKEVMEGDFQFLVETFIQDSSDRLAKLRELAGGDDKDAIRRAAHSFKGSCSNLGALRLASLCSMVERNALDGKLDSLSEDIAVIAEEFAQVETLLLAFLA